MNTFVPWIWTMETVEVNFYSCPKRDKAINSDWVCFMVCVGTRIMQGSGKVVIIAVGINSQAGIIFALLGAVDEKNTRNGKIQGSFNYLNKH